MAKSNSNSFGNTFQLQCILLYRAVSQCLYSSNKLIKHTFNGFLINVYQEF
jgi:hypothetical protein